MTKKSSANTAKSLAEVTVFGNAEFGEVRTVLVEDKPYFIASDIAKILDYRKASDMARILDEDEKGAHLVRTLGGMGV